MNLRYQICACLYQGTACEVFLVRDIVTSQLYALKRIVRHHAKFSDAYLRAVYQREALCWDGCSMSVSRTLYQHLRRNSTAVF